MSKKPQKDYRNKTKVAILELAMFGSVSSYSVAKTLNVSQSHVYYMIGELLQAGLLRGHRPKSRITNKGKFVLNLGRRFQNMLKEFDEIEHQYKEVLA